MYRRMGSIEENFSAMRVAEKACCRREKRCDEAFPEEAAKLPIPAKTKADLAAQNCLLGEYEKEF